MPYEYQVFDREFIEDPLASKGEPKIPRDVLLTWVNELGAKDWRLVYFFPEWCGWASALFEREIEVNRKLRDIQLGKKEKTDGGSNEKTD